MGLVKCYQFPGVWSKVTRARRAPPPAPPCPLAPPPPQAIPPSPHGLCNPLLGTISSNLPELVNKTPHFNANQCAYAFCLYVRRTRGSVFWNEYIIIVIIIITVYLNSKCVFTRWQCYCIKPQHTKIHTQKKTNSMVWVRERTIPTERPPLLGEVIANFCG
jgi:hypothetical protein